MESEGLIVGLTYNLKSEYPANDFTPDSAAECEDLQTVEKIIGALQYNGYRAVKFPYGRSLPIALQNTKVDVVLNIAEGWHGRNRESLVPAILEFLQIPYTGSDALTLGLALDKPTAKIVAKNAGIPTPRWACITSVDEAAGIQLDFPLFVKPAWEGSSKGVRSSSLVKNTAELKEMAAWLLKTYSEPVLVEEFLTGREFTVGVIGNNPPYVLPIMEIRPGTEGENGDFVYSYQTKSQNLERMICPAPVSSELKAQLEWLTLQAFRAFGCRDVARVDFRLDRSGNPNFLEINPLPGLSNVSLFPLQAQAAGISYEDLVGRIVRSAMERYGSPMEKDKTSRKVVAAYGF